MFYMPLYSNKLTFYNLWQKIISNTSSQIKNEGVNTYSGTTVPDNSLGKNGDLYITIHINELDNYQTDGLNILKKIEILFI